MFSVWNCQNTKNSRQQKSNTYSINWDGSSSIPLRIHQRYSQSRRSGHMSNTSLLLCLHPLVLPPPSTLTWSWRFTAVILCPHLASQPNSVNPSLTTHFADVINSSAPTCIPVAISPPWPSGSTNIPNKKQCPMKTKMSLMDWHRKKRSTSTMYSSFVKKISEPNYLFNITV